MGCDGTHRQRHKKKVAGRRHWDSLRRGGNMVVQECTRKVIAKTVGDRQYGGSKRVAGQGGSQET